MNTNINIEMDNNVKAVSKSVSPNDLAKKAFDIPIKKEVTERIVCNGCGDTIFDGEYKDEELSNHMFYDGHPYCYRCLCEKLREQNHVLFDRSKNIGRISSALINILKNLSYDFSKENGKNKQKPKKIVIDGAPRGSAKFVNTENGHEVIAVTLTTHNIKYVSAWCNCDRKRRNDIGMYNTIMIDDSDSESDIAFIGDYIYKDTVTDKFGVSDAFEFNKNFSVKRD